MIYSYTQIANFLACPRRYSFRYVQGWSEKDTRAGLLLAVRLRTLWLPCFDAKIPVPLSSASGPPTKAASSTSAGGSWPGITRPSWNRPRAPLPERQLSSQL